MQRADECPGNVPDHRPFRRTYGCSASCRPNLFGLALHPLSVGQRRAEGPGIGRKLMGDAEARALERGRHSAWVDTFSFQAPGFYPRL
jgi:hypothetical protein